MGRTYPYGKDVVQWVSTDWLQEHLYDDLTILDVQPDVHDYIKNHIQGAVFMHEGLLRCFRRNMPAHYVPEEAIQSVCRRSGLQNDKPVVVYTGPGAFKGWCDGLEQTMMAYTLARFGHNKVYVLDGGFDKWTAEGRETTKEYPIIEESDFSVNVRDEYFIGYEQFRQMKDSEDVIVLDVRPSKFYEGQGPWKKPGHIPGAVNLPWQDQMTKKNKRLLKPHDEIISLVEEHGIDLDKTIVCSCGTGREASNSFLLFKFYLGCSDVKVYEGSYTEWMANDQPAVTGSMPYETEAAEK